MRGDIVYGLTRRGQHTTKHYATRGFYKAYCGAPLIEVFTRGGRHTPREICRNCERKRFAAENRPTRAASRGRRPVPIRQVKAARR